MLCFTTAILDKMEQRRHARGVREVVANFSQIFWRFRTFGDVFGPGRTCPDLPACIQTRSDALGSVRRIGSVPTFSEIFEKTAEANDEICDPTALIFSEMCALRLEKQHFTSRVKTFIT